MKTKAVVIDSLYLDFYTDGKIKDTDKNEIVFIEEAVRRLKEKVEAIKSRNIEHGGL